MVSATIEVTTENLPVQLFARATGKLDTLFIADNQTVEAGEILAVIGSTADYGDVVLIRDGVTRDNVTRDSVTNNSNPPSRVTTVTRHECPAGALGDLQPAHSQYSKACDDYNYFIEADYHNQKIATYRQQIDIQKKLRTRTIKQSKIAKEQLEVQERLFSIDSSLYARKIATLLEFENSKKALLQMQQSYQSALNSVENIQLTITQYEQNIFDLQQQAEEKKKELLLSLSSSYESLQAQIRQWELQYVFESPVRGKVSFIKSWQSNSYISVGEAFVSIVPLESAEITGKILLPSKGAGKVKVGQAVNIKFDGFPYMEFGMVRGRVRAISLVPVTNQQGKFTVVDVEFPDDLTTNYGQALDFSQEMSGVAEIITEDMRLIDRLINPVRAVLRR